MNLTKTLRELRAYRSQLDQAIAALRELAARRPRQRGRPPGWLSEGPREKTRDHLAVLPKKGTGAKRRK